MNVPRTKINIIDVIREAGTLITGTKWPIFKRILLIGILAAAVGMWFHFITKGFTSTSRLFLSFAVSIVMAYIYIEILIPAYMFAVRRALGLIINNDIIKKECAQAQKKLRTLILFLVFLNCTTGIMVKLITPHYLGTIFAYVLYLLTLPIYFFAFPLIILNEQDSTSALSSAYQNMAIYWKEVLGGNIILLFIFGVIISAISYLQNWTAQSHHIFDIFYYHIFDLLYYVLQVLVAIWFVPLQFITNGIFFRKIFGAKKI